jgi:hypothetical protein
MLQFLDKATLGYAALFGLQADIVSLSTPSTDNTIVSDSQSGYLWNPIFLAHKYFVHG